MPKAFHISTKALISDGKKVLILKKEGSTCGSFWEIPGGRMEENETIIDALQRELREELPSIENIEIQNLVGAYKLAYVVPRDEDLMFLVYKVNAHLPVVTLSDEHSEYKWADRAELALLEDEALEALLSAEYQEMFNQELP
jgi:8-oxo-dGTP diphosphatase